MESATERKLVVDIIDHFSKPTSWFFHHYGVGDDEDVAHRIAKSVNAAFPSRQVRVEPSGYEECLSGQFFVSTTYYVCMDKMEKGTSH